MSASNLQPVLHAIIVGGGVVGMNCALSLQARGVAVTIVDPGAGRPASLGNAGHIAVEQVEPLASPATLRMLPRQLFGRGGAISLPLGEIATWLPFALRFVRAARPRRFRIGREALGNLAEAAIPAWRCQLERAGAAGLLVENGHFLVWESASAAEAGRARWAAADTGTVTFREASRDELAPISAQLRSPLAGGIRFSGSAQIADLEELAAAMVSNFEENGGKRVLDCAAKLERRSEGATLVLEGGKILTGDAIVVAAGVASAKLLAPLGHRAPIIAERGYHVQAASSAWPSDLPPVVFEERSMIVTRFRSGLRAAGFFEFARAERPPDPRKWARLRTNLEALEIAFDPPVKEWMGARPTLPDYLPAIGRSSLMPDLYYAFGHQHLGLTLAAATGEAIGGLVAGEAPPFDPALFSLDRFGRKKW